MKTALSRILEFFVGHDRREQDHPLNRSYCICGAFKPEAEGRQREASSKTPSRPQGLSVNQAWKQAPGLTKPASNYRFGSI
jgi:hypothetical protein